MPFALPPEIERWRGRKGILHDDGQRAWLKVSLALCPLANVALDTGLDVPVVAEHVDWVELDVHDCSGLVGTRCCWSRDGVDFREEQTGHQGR